MDRFPILVGLHIPKTGGTTLRRHIEPSVGWQHYYSCNPFSMARRAMNGKPQLPLYGPEQLASLRCVFGHALTIEEMFLLDPARLRVFTILRDPVDQIVSSYKETIAAAEDPSQIPSFDEFFETVPPDSMARTIHTVFSRLVDPQAEFSVAGLRAILGRLDNVLWTESLDVQARALCALIGIEGIPRRQRVYPDEVFLGNVTRADIAARNPISVAIAEEMREHGTGALGNPFSRQRTDWSETRAQIGGRLADPVALAYFAAFDFMRDRHMLHAYSVVMETRDDPGREMFGTYLADHEIDLTGHRPSIREQVELAVFLIDAKRSREAAQLLRALAEEVPDDFPVQFTLAKALQRDDAAAARAACERAIALNPTNQNARALMVALEVQ